MSERRRSSFPNLSTDDAINSTRMELEPPFVGIRITSRKGLGGNFLTKVKSAYFCSPRLCSLWSISLSLSPPAWREWGGDTDLRLSGFIFVSHNEKTVEVASSYQIQWDIYLVNLILLFSNSTDSEPVTDGARAPARGRQLTSPRMTEVMPTTSEKVIRGV